jgi:hypothetical protein
MSNRIEPTTHIDIRVVKNLLQSRITEGRDLMKTAALPNSWKRKEQACQDKLSKAMQCIEEAIKIKEGEINDISENQTPAKTNSEDR